MKVYKVDVNSEFYHGSGAAVGIIQNNKLVNAVYFSDFNIVEKLAELSDVDFEQILVPGMMSCYEFCTITDKIKNKSEAKFALQVYKDFLKIMQDVDNLIKVRNGK